jgi:hypothetical protein
MGAVKMKPLDTEGRLRLLRYGLIVVVVVTFLVTLLFPYATIAGTAAPISITEFLGSAVLYTIGVAVLAAVIYFAYRAFLTRST